MVGLLGFAVGGVICALAPSLTWLVFGRVVQGIGVVGQFLGWRALFVGTLVLALALIPFVRRVLPNGGSPDERAFDLIGGVLIGLAAGLFLFGVTQGQGVGFGSISSWGSFAGAAASAALFVLRINRYPHPFVSPALFKNRGYVTALLVGFLAMLPNLATLVLIPLLLIGENRLSVGAAGLALTPGAVALALLSPLSGRLSDE